MTRRTYLLIVVAKNPEATYGYTAFGGSRSTYNLILCFLELPRSKYSSSMTGGSYFAINVRRASAIPELFSVVLTYSVFFQAV